MADGRFFSKKGPFSLADLAAVAGGRLAEDADGAKLIGDVAPLESAGPDDISFCDNARYLGILARTKASALVLSPKYADKAPPGADLILSESAYEAYARIAQAFYPSVTASGTIDPSAAIDATARLGAGCEVGPRAVIGANVTVGDRCRVGAGTVIEAAVEIGQDCDIGANVSLQCCLIGNRVIVQSGAVIGTAGFGFAPNPAGHVAVPQVGRVVIGDECHIGANVTIARGSVNDTVLGRNVWIDNLVQIAHNVTIGDSSILVSQSGIAGSTRLGNFVVVAAQAGLIGHLTIGDNAQIGAQAGVIRDVAAGETVLGSPAVPVRDFWRQVSTLQRLSKRKEVGDD